jgi:hypothetical protein
VAAPVFERNHPLVEPYYNTKISGQSIQAFFSYWAEMKKLTGVGGINILKSHNFDNPYLQPINGFLRNFLESSTLSPQQHKSLKNSIIKTIILISKCGQLNSLSYAANRIKIDCVLFEISTRHSCTWCWYYSCGDCTKIVKTGIEGPYTVQRDRPISH